MEDSYRDITIGFAQEIPGGYVFEIGNNAISRRIHCISKRIGTTSLINGLNGEEYLDEAVSEFDITLAGEGQYATLDFKEFNFKGYSTPNWNDSIRTLQLQLEADVNGKPLPVSVFYEVKAGESFLRKWLEIGPCDLENWVITKVTIENLKFKEMVEGVIPKSRYTQRYENYEDKVHAKPDEVDVTDPNERFTFGDMARAVTAYWGYGEGLFFFTESLLGEEKFYRPSGLVMAQRDYTPLTQKLITGPAVIGAYAGSPEVGFKRYNEHLLRNWCAVHGKKTPVTWNTWLITTQGDIPLHGNYDRNFLMDYIELLEQAGFYDALQLDLGWEAKYPLNVDEDKFPNGMGEIARRAKGAADMDMMFWINPFSCNYWKSWLEDERPEWLVPGKVSGRSGATALCVMTEYAEHVKQRIIDLVVGLNASAIYWDGNDWNIPQCNSSYHEHETQEELRVKALRRLAGICRAAHEARPDLLIIAFTPPMNNHFLCVLDKEQISDPHSFPTLQAELIQRQQIYQMTFEHPYKAIWGSWYGVNWYETGERNLTERPMHELIHAEMSMIGNGLAQAGGSIDLKQAKPEFVEFLRKLFAFRKRFENYFETYQHILGFPDGEHIDGEGHIIEGSGFIILINPAKTEQSVKLPLNEAELELSSQEKHELTDWSNLEEGRPIGSARLNDAPEIDLAPLEVKYIGINIGD